MPKFPHILAIDTALRSCSVGVMSAGEVVFEETQIMGRGQDQALAGMVDQALQGAHITPKNLSAIAVTTGPGSFTGIRVGMAFARGMASVLKIPLVGLTTTEVLINQISGNGAAIIEIKKDAYIAQIFTKNIAQTELIALNEKELIQTLSGNQVRKAITHTENVQSLISIDCVVSMPIPSGLLKMAQQRLAIQKNEEIVRPVYVRPADVTIKN